MKIKNPKLKIETDLNLEDIPVLVNNNFVFTTKTGSFESIAVRDVEEDVFVVNVNADGSFTIEDAVNCTQEGNTILITDPTKDASCTVYFVLG